MIAVETITVGGVTLEIKRQTPRTRMVRNAVYRKLAKAQPDIEAALQIELADETWSVSSSLVDFGVLGSRVTVANGAALDFQLPTPLQTPEEMKANFMRYLDTQHDKLLNAAMAVINRLDEADDEALAPGAETAKKKTPAPGASGNKTS